MERGSWQSVDPMKDSPVTRQRKHQLVQALRIPLIQAGWADRRVAVSRQLRDSADSDVLIFH